jgi:hypothetical protein
VKEESIGVECGCDDFNIYVYACLYVFYVRYICILYLFLVIYFTVFSYYMEDPGSLQSALLLLYEDDPRGPYYFSILYFFMLCDAFFIN